MYEEQTIWLSPRATGFTDACDACVDERPEAAGTAGTTISGTLAPGAAHGWARCAHGHEVRVLRMTLTMPAGALR